MRASCLLRHPSDGRDAPSGAHMHADRGVKDGVRVNAINPGATRTRMRAAAYPGENPVTRPTADSLMPLYLYLMGPDSQGVSGYSFDAQPV